MRWGLLQLFYNEVTEEYGCPALALTVRSRMAAGGRVFCENSAGTSRERDLLFQLFYEDVPEVCRGPAVMILKPDVPF